VSEICSAASKVMRQSLKEHMRCRYNFTQTHCIHGTGCKNRKEGRDCRIGMRLQRTQLITGEQVTPLCSFGAHNFNTLCNVTAT